MKSVAAKQQPSTAPGAATRIAFYARASTEDQAEKDTSRNQLQYLQRKYAVDLAPDSPTPMQLVGEFTDDGWSGAITLGERPEGQRLLEIAKLGQIDAVVIYRLDRLGRTAKVLLEAHEKLEQLGVAIISATEPFDTRTSIGRFVFQLLGSIAELERATIRDRLNLGRDRVAREGRFLNGPIPYGYDVDHAGFLIPSERRVESLDCTEAEVARLIIQKVADGGSGRRVAQWLTTRNVPAPKRYRDKHGGEHQTLYRDWAPDRIWNMCNDSLYRGVRVLHHTAGDIEQTVPALVDDVTWHRAHAQLGQNRVSRMAVSKYTYLLRGRIFCGACGGMLLGNYQARVNRLYYTCGKAPGKAAARRGQCEIGYFRGEPVEDLILREIDEFIENPGQALDEVREQVRQRQGTAAQHEGTARRLHERLRETEEAKRDVMALVKRRRITVDEADAQLEEVAQEAADLRRELDLLESHAALADAMESQLLDTARLLGEIREQWSAWRHAGDRAHLKEVVQQLVLEVRLRPDGSVDRTYAFGQPSSTAAQLYDHADQIRRARGGS